MTIRLNQLDEIRIDKTEILPDIGIDLFFGGGAFDFNRQASAGRLVDSGVLERHPSWFAEDSIPHIVSGEEFYDEEGRWVGAVISAFGICFNTDSLERLGVDEIPASWEDLTRPEFVKEVALADPTKSGSVAKAFEMIGNENFSYFLLGRTF